VSPERDDRRDRDLLRRLADGEAAALGDLYDRHARSLFRHGVALAGNTTDAEDLVQTVFVKLATTGAELLVVRTPASYLHRMLSTSWFDARRRRARAGEECVDETTGRTSAAALDGNGPGLATTEGSNDRVDAALDVDRALRALPVVQRQVVVLHVFDGFSFREIGRMTGVSMFTASGRYRLAIAKLRQVMEP
jgi:RNA polymerase sigma-70 factor (ECF subfamily)